MYRRLTVVLAFCIFFSPLFAFSAKMKNTWKNPSATESSLQFEKILVVVAIKQDFTRKVAEDKVVRILKERGRHAIPSYFVLSAAEFEDKEYAKSKVEGMGFDGAIVMNYAYTGDSEKYHEQEKDWEAYNYFWGQYYPAWGGVYNSTSPNDTKLLIETKLYSLKEQKLIWSGITETKNGKNPAIVVGDIAEETAKYLRQQGLIAQKQ